MLYQRLPNLQVEWRNCDDYCQSLGSHVPPKQHNFFKAYGALVSEILVGLTDWRAISWTWANMLCFTHLKKVAVEAPSGWIDLTAYQETDEELLNDPDMILCAWEEFRECFKYGQLLLWDLLNDSSIEAVRKLEITVCYRFRHGRRMVSPLSHRVNHTIAA